MINTDRHIDRSNQKHKQQIEVEREGDRFRNYFLLFRAKFLERLTYISCSFISHLLLTKHNLTFLLTSKKFLLCRQLTSFIPIPIDTLCHLLYDFFLFPLLLQVELVSLALGALLHLMEILIKHLKYFTVYICLCIYFFQWNISCQILNFYC